MLAGCTPWPEDVARRYREQGLWCGETLGELLRGWARAYGPRTALVHGARRITYAELDAWVDRLAAGLLRDGVAPGDRVVVQLPNVPEFVATCFALFRADAKPVFSLMAHRSNEIGHLAGLSEATALVVPGTYQGFDHAAMAAEVAARCPSVRRVLVLDGTAPAAAAGGQVAFGGLPEADARPLPAPDPSDVAFFLLSGGTTALPKLIPRTHDDYAYQLRTFARENGLGPDDVYLAALPVEFNFAWGCPGVLGTLCAGGRVVLSETGAPTECFEAVEAEGVTHTALVPTLAQLWLDAMDAAPFDAASLRLIQIGGAPLHRDIAARIGPAFGCRLQQVFGMAEGLLSITRDGDPLETVLTTQGRPLSPADEVRIVDESGAEVPTGEVGELQARGPYTLRGYYRAPEHNARVFTADGFFRTGDLARRTERGDLVIEGRLKDVIIRAGNKISAAEVEGYLLAHPAVARVAVIGTPDDYLGEQICAVVQPAGDPPSLNALRQALRDLGIAAYKLPDRLLVVDELPLTGLGKIDRKRLVATAGGPP